MKSMQDFSIRKVKEGEIETFYYDENALLTEDKSQSCAEVTKIGVKKIFKIMAGRTFKLFNPLNKSNSYNLKAKDKTTSDSMFKLREVTEDAFNQYLAFLRTKQDSFLTVAERKVKQ